MGMREEYSKKLQNRLAELDAEAKKLEDVAVEKGIEAEKELKKLMEKYAANRQEIDQRLQKLRGRLTELDTEAKKLEAMAAEKGAEAEKELKKLMEKYIGTREEIEQKLTTLQHTSKDAWKDMSEGIEKALQELKVAYSKASSRFK